MLSYSLLVKRRRRRPQEKDPGPENLFRPATDGDVDRVRIRLAAGVDPNQPDLFGSLPLAGAAANGHEEVVRVLLAAGADVNGASFWLENVDRESYKVQRTPLVCAALGRQESVALLLIEHGADVNATDGFSGTTALVEAARNGFEKLVAALLARGARVDARDGYDNLGVLKAGVRGGNTQIVRMLLAHSAPADPEALLEACRTGHLEIVQVLFEAGFDPRTSGLPAEAAWGGHRSLLEHLLDRYSYSEAELGDALVEAADAETTRMLLARHTYPEAVLGRALARAGNNGEFEKARLLLSHAAPIDGRDQYGWTALMCAAAHGLADMVCFLIDHGAKRGIAEAIPVAQRPEMVNLLKARR
jgi:ankyrin repeat protein